MATLIAIERANLIIGLTYYDCDSKERECLRFCKRDKKFLYFKTGKKTVYFRNDEGYITFDAHTGSPFFQMA